MYVYAFGVYMYVVMVCAVCLQLCLFLFLLGGPRFGGPGGDVTFIKRY